MLKSLYPLAALTLTASSGCQTSPPPENTTGDTQQLLNKPLAYVNGQTVTERDVLTPLIESDAGQVLSEIVLDRMIDQRLEESGLAVDAAAVDAERERVIATLDPDPDVATRLLRQFRRQRGLGEMRFEAFLRRNASLRLLVADRVTITPTALGQEYELVYGPRYQPRIIVAATASDAARLRKRILDGGESFSDLATVASTDRSAAQGGLLSPISPADASYPQMIRAALTRLEVGHVSDVIAIESGFALLKLVRVIEGEDISIDDAREELERSLRLRQERLLMQQLAREMIASANVVVLNEAMEAGWDYRRQLLVNEGEQ